MVYVWELAREELRSHYPGLSILGKFETCTPAQAARPSRFLPTIDLNYMGVK